MRISFKQAKRFSEKFNPHIIVSHAQKYLEMADGDQELARMIAGYYLEGGEHDYTIGQVIRDYWLREGQKDANVDGLTAEQWKVAAQSTAKLLYGLKDIALELLEKNCDCGLVIELAAMKDFKHLKPEPEEVIGIGAIFS